MARLFQRGQGIGAWAQSFSGQRRLILFIFATRADVNAAQQPAHYTHINDTNVRLSRRMARRLAEKCPELAMYRFSLRRDAKGPDTAARG